MLKKRRFFIGLITALNISLLTGVVPLNTAAASSTITVNLTQTSEAFKNPMKGFRPQRFLWVNKNQRNEYEYASTYKQYIRYTDLENSPTDTVQKIKDWSNVAWAGIENKNIKIIPRVFIVYPKDSGSIEEYWPEGIPHDGTANEWLTDTLKSRLVAVVAKLGQAWDNDPRVAAIELGLWGNWGEQHIYPKKLPDGSDRIPLDFQNALGDAATKAFINKKVMIRYPKTFIGYNFGDFWDSFAVPDDTDSGNGIIARNAWQTQMNSGEVAYNWGDLSFLGKSPDDTLKSSSSTDYVIDWIKKTHTSSLGWISEYDETDSDIADNAIKMQKALGYRYFINQASFSYRADQGGSMNISFNVSNVGSAPFYYNWPVEASFLKSDKSVAWSGTFKTDIRKWLPDNSYDVSETFSIPTDLASGTYTLALTVLDPAGNKPSLRFANTNYYKGGRTPIGKIGVGQDPADQNLGSFDYLESDNTLSYSLTGIATPTSTYTAAATGESTNSIKAHEDKISVVVNDKKIDFDTNPRIIDNTVFVPLRKIFETFGLEATWIGDSQTVIGVRGKLGITLQVGNKTAIVNDTIVNLDVPAQNIDGRILVPLRFISENLRCKVKWDEKSNTVIIKTKD